MAEDRQDNLAERLPSQQQRPLQQIVEQQPGTQQQSAGDIGISGQDNATAFVNAETATVDQSRHRTIINYYYREVAVAVDDEDVPDDLPCPYRGLYHFGPNDAEYFFGREVFVTALAEATQQRTFIPVLGASGSGKSSVVLAGLVPRLQQAGHWQFTHFRPGKDPFHALALALLPLYSPGLDDTDRMVQSKKLASYLRDGEVTLEDVVANIQRHYPQDRILLIADQFEELYTLTPEDPVRQRFLDCLLTRLATPDYGSAPLVMVTTMRADFLSNALAYRPFVDVLQSSDIKLGAMTPEELTQAIERPAQKLGIEFEGGLVNRILEDVSNEPGNLPLLEFALTELWKRRSGKCLTHDAYEEIGEVEGALTRHADAKFGTLSPEAQQEVRRIFVQLVRPGQGTEDTRRLATKGELGEADWSLVKHLADARLVVTSVDPTQQHETVEVIHEALIRNWGQLRQWMTADREFRVWQERLRGALRQWESVERDEGALLRGAPLAETEGWLETRREDLSLAERRFVEASVELREREAWELEARRQKELGQARRVAAGATISGVLMAGLALFVGLKTRESEIQQIETSIALSDASLAIGHHLDADVESVRAATILTQSWWRATMSSGLKSSVLGQLHQTSLTGYERNRLTVYQGSIMSVAFSPDGSQFATSGQDGTVLLWDSDGGQLTVLEGHQEAVWKVAFSPNGSQLITSGQDGTVRLWDSNGEQLAVLESDQKYVREAAFSPDGSQLVTAERDGTIRLWDGNGQQLTVLEGHQGSAWDVTFSPDGSKLATAGEDATARLWNSDGVQLAVFEGHQGDIWNVAFSPDGSQLATAGEDGTARLWDSSGEQLAVFEGHQGDIWNVAFSPDGSQLVTRGSDGTARLWDSSGVQLAAFEGHQGDIWNVAFSPDGSQLLTGGVDGTVRLWDSSGEQLAVLEGHQGGINDIAFNHDGSQLLTGGVDGTVRLWDSSGEQLAVLEGHQGGINDIAFNRDGSQLVTRGSDGTVRLWDSSGEQLAVLEGHQGDVRDVAFSPDGSQLLTGGSDGTVRLWDSSGEQLTVLEGHQGPVWDVTFSPDGSQLLTGGRDRTARLWDSSGQQLAVLEGHQRDVMDVTFSPDGSQLLTRERYGTVRLWDSSGEQLSILEGHQGSAWDVTFSPDGSQLSTGGEDGTARLWDSSGQQLAVVKGHQGSVTEVAFSLDGEQLATAGEDGTAWLWKSNGQQLAVLKGHQGPVWNVVFSPDGSQLATAGEDGTTRLWDGNGEQLAVLKGHRGSVTAISFSPNGSQLVTGGRDGTIRLWPIEEIDESLIRQCSWIRDYLENNAPESDRHLCDGIGND